MENLATIVGKNLATLRKAKGLTQQDLAREINYSDKSISKWELGYSLPSVDILKDFAQFYGVTIDYLVSEQTAEDLEAKAKEDVLDQRAKKINQALSIALTCTSIFLVALCVFLNGTFNPFGIDRKPFEGLWIVFVWMVPVALFVVTLLSWHYYHRRAAFVALSSCFMWTLLLSFCIHFQFARTDPEIIWYILIVGVPIQIMLILWGNFKPKRKAAKKPK